ncbi:hypothetical protein NE237_022098 [Protea cynaroides]|uniref:Uncharacterized protein n=1 Tax=Protea cynaroides TaxID=273540 RepID=A0A9Q0HAB1_9MAGN|nr:hypothetical protein NE237_022098 [Protea cynaroides]
MVGNSMYGQRKSSSSFLNMFKPSKRKRTGGGEDMKASASIARFYKSHVSDSNIQTIAVWVIMVRLIIKMTDGLSITPVFSFYPFSFFIVCKFYNKMDSTYLF